MEVAASQSVWWVEVSEGMIGGRGEGNGREMREGKWRRREGIIYIHVRMQPASGEALEVSFGDVAEIVRHC